MANVPAELRYTEEHEWAKQEGERILLACACDSLCQRLQTRKAPLIDPHALSLDGERKRSPLRIGHRHTYERRRYLTHQRVVRS